VDPTRVIAPLLGLLVSSAGGCASSAPRAVDRAPEPRPLKIVTANPDDAPPPIVTVVPVPPPEPFSGLTADDALVLDAEACRALLDEWGVPWEPADDAPDSIEQPIRLSGPVAGVRFTVPGEEGTVHEVLDCRLAVSLAEWARQLAAHGVVGAKLFSFYRRGARVGSHVRPEPTQHNYGLAADVGWFELADGRELVVREDFRVETEGSDTCAGTPRDEPATLLLAFFCEPIAESIFHVQLSPAHDREHFNHYHVDIGGSGGVGGWFVQ
jgi:hypothetical protein